MLLGRQLVPNLQAEKLLVRFVTDGKQQFFRDFMYSVGGGKQASLRRKFSHPGTVKHDKLNIENQ